MKILNNFINCHKKCKIIVKNCGSPFISFSIYFPSLTKPSSSVILTSVECDIDMKLHF